MEQNMGTGITQLINFILSNIWIVVLIGIVHILFTERNFVLSYFKNKKYQKEQLNKIWHRGWYLFGGIALSLLAFSIVYTITYIFISSGLPHTDLSTLRPGDFWATMKYQSQFAGLYTVAGIIAAGYCLILSAGGKWLVNTAKLLVTVSLLYLFFSIFVMYA